MARAETSLAESVCLAVVVGGVDYGGAVADLLAPGAELGRIWSLSRPLTYRAIDALVTEGLLTRTGTAPGRGPDRRLLAPTRRGRAATRRWLAAPVEHLRDVRTVLLLKFRLLERMGSPLAPLARAQRDRFAPMVTSIIETDPADEAADDASADPADVVTLWRREHARAVVRFLEHVIDLP
ncbi:MAG: PadR family transcriptional regulator [Acidobacteria bacterium]|nr:PadR family transcriptional regulator [Acidobacteriota bacterium]